MWAKCDMRQCNKYMNEQISSMDESVIRGCHPWMKKPHPLMKVSSMNAIHGWSTLINGWHPWMKMDGVCVSGAIVVGLKCSKKCMLGYGNSSARSSFSYAMQRSKAEQPLLCPLVRFSAAAAKQPSSRLDKIRHIIRSSAVATTTTPTALPYSTFVHQAFRLQFFDVSAGYKTIFKCSFVHFSRHEKMPSFFALKQSLLGRTRR